MIEVRNLHKSFGAQQVLRGVDLRIARGEALVILGRSGCGKSILLKHLIGLLRPDSGEVWVDGKNLADLNERRLLEVRRRFGMLFQGAALFDSLTVAENVGFALRHQEGLSASETRQRVAEALAMVELSGTEAKKPAELSGGMRKRAGLARAIVYRPEILLYDEPTTGLDPIAADRIDRLIARICSQLNATSVAVTHDLRSAERIGRRFLLLHEGRVHFSGTPAETFQSVDPVVRHFVHGVSDAQEAAI